MPEPLTSHPHEPATDLAAVGAEVRAEWRVDEALWMQAAAERWAHRRRVGDLLREFAARGDRVAVDVAGHTFDGIVLAVGDDRVDLATAIAVVSVRTALSDAHGAVAAPLAIRRSQRARAGGVRLPAALVTFRARLRELEAGGLRVRVGTFVAGGELVGRLVVGDDHVVVSGADEVVVPAAWVAYVSEAPGEDA